MVAITDLVLRRLASGLLDSKAYATIACESGMEVDEYNLGITYSAA